MLALTGAAGFIGSNLMAAWNIHENSPIAAFDVVDSAEKKANIAQLRNVIWVEPTDTYAFLQANADSIDSLIHLGAETSTTATDRGAVFKVNVELSKCLWSWCAENSVPFIYASSAAVYGDGSSGFLDDPALDTLNTLKPLNIYAESKLAFDVFISQALATGAARPPQWAGLRFFNVYGPREAHKGSQASVVSQMLPSAIRGESYALFRSHRNGVADGKQMRDFVFVDDCIDVMRWLLKTPQISGILNVGSGSARTFLDLANAVYSAAEQSPNITWRDTPAHIQDHYQYFTKANLERLRTTGYANSFTSLEDGVAITLRDYLSKLKPHQISS
ncbi:MAG: ADP-glyceromanno-heptose 6-epimerase [Rhodospirillaceae bacterium]